MHVPTGYRQHFRSIDGKIAIASSWRPAGGPTWYDRVQRADRAVGAFRSAASNSIVTRHRRQIASSAACRRRCAVAAIRPSTLYPASGAFLARKRFQTTSRHRPLDRPEGDDARSDVEPDRFYFDQARARCCSASAADKPMFMFVYTGGQSFPWTCVVSRPTWHTDWRDLGNARGRRRICRAARR